MAFIISQRNANPHELIFGFISPNSTRGTCSVGAEIRDVSNKWNTGYIGASQKNVNFFAKTDWIIIV